MHPSTLFRRALFDLVTSWLRPPGQGRPWSARAPAIVLLIAVAVAGLATSAFALPAMLSPGAETRPHIRLAFVRGGNIWVLDVASGAETRLTTDGHDTAPWWTVDGKSLFFTNQEPGQTGRTFRWSPGAEPRAVTSGLWSPDGLSVAFVQAGPGTGAANTIWVERSGQRARITPLESGVRWTILGWSRDGQRLALGRIGLPPSPTPGPGGVLPTNGSLWVTDGGILGAQVRPLLTVMPPAVGAIPGWPDLAVWSPTDRFLAVGVGPNEPCNSCRADGLPYFAVPIDGGSPIPLGSALAPTEAISWAPTGSFVVLSGPLGRETYVNKHLTRIDLPGGTRHDLTSDARWADVEPAVAPDRRTVAFARGRAQQPISVPGGPAPGNRPVDLIATRHLWLIDADGTSQRQITSSADWTDDAPVWTPDGRWIVFVRWHSPRADQPAVAEVWAIRPDGSSAQRLVASLDLPSSFLDGFGYYGTFGWRSLFAVAPR